MLYEYWRMNIYRGYQIDRVACQIDRVPPHLRFLLGLGAEQSSCVATSVLIL